MTYNEYIQNILDTRGRFGVPEGKYKERHHITPRCMGGTDDENNLIDLYAREHFIAHWLLVNENPDNVSLVHAFWAMVNGHWYGYNYIDISADEYEYGRERYAKVLSTEMTGANNHMYGKPCYYNMSENEIKNWKESLLINSPKRLIIKCIETGEIFRSEREAARITGIPRSRIRKSKLYNLQIEGKTFIEIDKNTNEEIIKLSPDDWEDKISGHNERQSIATKKWWDNRKASGDSGRASALKGKETMRKKYNTGSGYVAHKQIINKKGEK